MKTKSVSKRLFAFLLSVAVIVGLFSNIALADTAIMQDSVEMQNEFKEDLTTESNLKVMGILVLTHHILPYLQMVNLIYMVTVAL